MTFLQHMVKKVRYLLHQNNMQAQLFYVGIKSYIWDEWKRKQKQGALSMKTRKKVNICKIEQRKILNYAYIKRR